MLTATASSAPWPYVLAVALTLAALVLLAGRAAR